MKKTILVAALLALGVGNATAETLSAKGTKEVSIKASGDLVNARRIAREQAELDAIASILKLKLATDMSNPEVRGAIPQLRTQLADNMRTSFNAEGDILTAKTDLAVDSAALMDLAGVLKLTSKTKAASAKVLFLIDEYYGIATKLDPSQPILTEIDYSHDKSSFSDRTATASGSQSSSSAAASASKSSFAAASSEKAAFAASSSSSVAARDRASFSGSDQRAAAIQDGYGGSAAGARSTQVAGSRDSSFAGAQKSSAAGSMSAQSAVSASSQSASASRSASSAKFAARQNDVQQQNDIVNLKVRQAFPGIDNAKPADESTALINQKLQQVVKEYGLAYTDERDFRVENGHRLTVAEIGKMQKFDSYMQKAGRGNYNAKYLVYGTAIMNSEGRTPSDQVSCSGHLALSSSNVDSGEGLVSDGIVKRAIGSSDQNCRANLSEALARELADKISSSAQRQLQQEATQGRSYTLSMYASHIPSKLRREFSAKVKELDGVVEISDDDNATEQMRRWIVVAKGNFSEKIEDLIDDITSSANSPYKGARFEKRGSRMAFCVDGSCPVEL